MKIIFTTFFACIFAPTLFSSLWHNKREKKKCNKTYWFNFGGRIKKKSNGLLEEEAENKNSISVLTYLL